MSTDLPTLCATLDHGSGVHLPSSNTFLIYTIKPLPPFPPPEALLSHQATKVTLTLPLHLTPTTLPEPPTSIPTNPPTSTSKDKIPPFILHATHSTHLALAGHTTPLYTLLTLLRRPWCVLELSLAPTLAVHELYSFAEVASSLDPKGYGHAVSILGHEESSRLRESGGSGEEGEGEGVWEFYGGLWESSQASFQRFWIVAICVCARVLGVGFRAFMARVGGMGGEEGSRFVLRVYREALKVLTRSIDCGVGRRMTTIKDMEWRMAREIWEGVDDQGRRERKVEDVYGLIK